MCWILKNKTLILVLMNFFVVNLMFGQSVRTEQHIRLENPSDKSKYLLLSAPSNLNTILNFQFPPTSGTNGQVLTTNGSGGLSWSAPAAPTMRDTTITTATTLNGNHDIYIIASTNGIHIKLPLSSDFKGKTITIKAKPQGANTYNVGPLTGDQLDYAIAIRQIYASPSSGNYLRGITVYSDGSQWHTISTINY